jgi:hypothetical protein
VQPQPEPAKIAATRIPACSARARLVHKTTNIPRGGDGSLPECWLIAEWPPEAGLGIDHFEGRSFVGWHRHVTLTVLAQAFCTLLRLDRKAMRRPDPLRVIHELQQLLVVMAGECHLCNRPFDDTT